jgi:hypothetical protein
MPTAKIQANPRLQDRRVRSAIPPAIQAASRDSKAAAGASVTAAKIQAGIMSSPLTSTHPDTSLIIS